MRGVLFSLLFLRALSASVQGIDSIAVTVSDLDRSVDFYTKVLTFEKESEREIEGENWEHLYGLFGMKARVARLRLGNERLERYADLAVRVGANVPEGQTVFVNGRIEHAPLVRALTRASYRAGARFGRGNAPGPTTSATSASSSTCSACGRGRRHRRAIRRWPDRGKEARRFRNLAHLCHRAARSKRLSPVRRCDRAVAEKRLPCPRRD